MVKPRGWSEWEDADARGWIPVPTADDDKYSRGVLGVRTGSDDYPGAAVLGVEAALRSGVGMVRYLGPRRASDLVLQRRPEAVVMPGRVQAWLLGSGMSAASRDAAGTQGLRASLAEGLPTVLDAGALKLVGQAGPVTAIVPHYRELASALSDRGQPVTATEVSGDPARWASTAAGALGVTVLLKGSVTHVASPSGIRLTVSGAPAWLATAGTGDVLGGIFGALVATSADRAAADADAMAALAATAALIHSRAAANASAGGPLTALGVAEAVPDAIRALIVNET
jgi:NAD(P)H-hydrate repair Nnr-like enzyme with NAD(P)H-hydrate dehydratase domain